MSNVKSLSTKFYRPFEFMVFLVLTLLLLKMNVALVQVVDYGIDFYAITDNLLDKNVNRN